MTYSALQMVSASDDLTIPDPIPMDDVSEYSRWLETRGLGEVILPDDSSSGEPYRVGYSDL